MMRTVSSSKSATHSSAGQKKSPANASLHIQTFSPTRQSPSNRSPKKASKAFSPSKFPLYDPEITATASSTGRDDSSSTTLSDELLFEDTFCCHLAALKRVLLQYTAASPGSRRNTEAFDPYLDQRAAQLINEDIRRTLVKIKGMRPSSSRPDDEAVKTVSDKTAAYSFVSANLTNEVERLVAKEDTHVALNLLKDELSKVSAQYRALQVHVSQLEVRHAEKMSKIEEENKGLVEKLSALVRRNNTLSTELDLRLKMEEEAHAKYVQLHLQSVNYHTRVNQLVGAASGKISSRMGYVPRGVQEALQMVREIPAPGADMVFMQSGAIKKGNKSPRNSQKSSARGGLGLTEGIQLLRATSRSEENEDGQKSTAPKFRSPGSKSEDSATAGIPPPPSSAVTSSADPSLFNSESGNGRHNLTAPPPPHHTEIVLEMDDVYNHLDDGVRGVCDDYDNYYPDIVPEKDGEVTLAAVADMHHGMGREGDNGAALRSVGENGHFTTCGNDSEGSGDVLTLDGNVFLASPILSHRSFNQGDRSLHEYSTELGIDTADSRMW